MNSQHDFSGRSLWSAIRWGVLVLSTASLTGCSLLGGSSSDTAEPSLTHTVRYSGETLGVISSWYTGTPRFWRDIKAANPRLDERRIRLGQEIQVPLRLVTNTGQLNPQAVAMIQRRITGAPDIQDLAWKEAEDLSYSYPVRTIAGCGDLPNSISGLHECANRMGQQVRTVKASQDG